MSSEPSNQHRIRQAVFDLRVPDERTAFAVRKQLVDAFPRTVVPALEEACDAFAQPGRTHRIDRIEIDLGIVEPARLDPDAIRRLVLEQLDGRVGTTSRQSEATTVSTLAETLVVFLESGSWPWHATRGRIEDLEQELFELEPAARRYVASRLRPLLERGDIRLRVVRQFSREFFEWLVRLLEPSRAEDLLRIGRKVLPDLGLSESQAVLLGFVAELGGDVAAATFEVRLREYADQVIAGEATADGRDDDDGFPPHKMAAEPSGASTEEEKNEREAAKFDVFYVSYAGIVLLHPFLERFFGVLGLLDDHRRFVSNEAQAKAVHVLYFLATGRSQPQEHETVLLKLLCGLPIRAPLVKDLSLSAETRDEAENLMDAVIRHWTKIGNTSTAGLRETFLQRDGKLSFHENEWRLVVEQRSVDVLLGHVPWGLSIVRLPWMQLRLSVDWA